MKNIILCEGRTDAILLSYYLEKMYGWKFDKKIPKPYSAIKLEANQELNWYKRGEDYLAIWGVGGKDNFKNVLDMYVIPMILNYPSEESFARMAIVADKDDDSVEEMEKRQKEWLFPYMSNIKQGVWQHNSFIDEFGTEQNLEVLSIMIPSDKQGALETILLESISENDYDRWIVENCADFVEKIKPNTKKYIPNNRMAVKAHLATVFAILSPEKVFSALDTIIKNVKWEESAVLKECFRGLEKL